MDPQKEGVGAGFRRGPILRQIFRGFMKPKCDLCGDRHEPHQAHKFATNTSATNRNATNRITESGSSERSLEGRRGKEEHQEVLGSEVGASVAKTKNRRSRDAYNAYQREYMRKYRSRRGK